TQESAPCPESLLGDVRRLRAGRAHGLAWPPTSPRDASLKSDAQVPRGASGDSLASPCSASTCSGPLPPTANLPGIMVVAALRTTAQRGIGTNPF
ncbi:unnamed protein product, partial [Ixodes persulcatus]